MPPMAMNRFVTWARLGIKSKEQLQQPSSQPYTTPSLPEHGQEKEKLAEVADPPPFRDSLDHRSADVGQPNDTPPSNGEDMVTPKEGAVAASASKLSIHSVGSAHDSASSAERPDLPNPPSDAPPTQSMRLSPRLKHSRSFFSTFTIAKKLRIRKRDLVPLDRTPDNFVPAHAPDISRRLTHRPKPVSIPLPNDITSKERREEALRARGLLPPRDLSAVEADEDRRIDALHKKSTSLSCSDNTDSDANDIAQAWRIRNSKWLSESLPNLDTSEDPMTEVSPPTDASGLSEELLAFVTVGADEPASVPLIDSPSISKFLTLGLDCSPSQSLKAASSKESIGHEGSPSSRADSPSSSNPEGLMLPSSCLEDSPTDTPTGGAQEDVKTTSAQSAPSSPALSKTSLHSQIAEKPQASAPSLPSHQQDDSQTHCSLPQSPSEPRIESSPKPLPTEAHPEPLDVTVQARRSVPDLSPLLLFPIVSDTLLASPTTPTLSPSVCYASSEASDSTPTADNGVLIASPISDVMPIKGRPADITPFAVKSSDGGVLCQEVILEGSEPFPDEEDLDPFATSPSSPSLPTVVTTPPNRSRNRASTLGPPPSAATSKSVPLMGLRRTFTNSLFRRPRARTTVSHLAPTDLSPPPSPLEVRVHNRSTIYEEASRIDDDEVRRLSELAFMT